MRNSTKRRIISLMVILGLVLTWPRPGAAVLTEAVVGGSILLQMGSVALSSLPQLIAVGAGVMTLLQQSEAIVNSAKRIFDLILPGTSKKKKQPEPRVKIEQRTPKPEPMARTPLPKPPSNPIPKLLVEETRPPVAPATANAGSMAEQIRNVVATFYQKMGLEEAVRKLPDASPEREAMGAGLSDLEAIYTQATLGLANKVMDAVMEGDQKIIDGFVQKVEALDVSGKIAVAPVFVVILDKGERFNQLHGGEDGAGASQAFEALSAAYRRMTE